MRLSINDVAQFFQAHRALMVFVNHRLGVTAAKIDSPEAYALLPPEKRSEVHRALLDHVDLIDKRLASQDRRTEKIFELVSEKPRTGHGIADAIWGNIALTQAYLTLSEVIGHLDILLEEGRVVETTRPLEDSDLELTYYEATK